MEDVREDVATSAVGHDSTLDVKNFFQAWRNRSIDRKALKRRIEEVDLAISSTFHFGNIKVEDLGFEGEEGLLNELSSSEKLFAILRSLTCCLVLAPTLGLARLAAVEGCAFGASVLGVNAASAASGCRPGAGRADATRRGLRGHGCWCDVEGNFGVEEKIVVHEWRRGSF